MRKRVTIVLCSMIMLVMNIHAQKKAEIAVTIAVEQLRKAMVDGDSTTLANLVMDQLSYGHSGGQVEGKKEFIEEIISGKSDFVTIDLTEQAINISDKTAIVRHRLTAKTNDNGKPGEVHLRVLLVWQQQNGKWKLLARQAVKIMS